MRFRAVFMRFHGVCAVLVWFIVFAAKTSHVQGFGVKCGLFRIVCFVPACVLN